MRVVLARHGESVANVERVISNRDLPHGLTAVGRGQAGELAERIRARGVVAVYSSPVPRAVQTAVVVCERFGLAPVLADGLREPDRGVLEGRGDPEAWRRHDEVTRRWVVDHDRAARCPGGESLDDVLRRLEAFLALLARRHGSSDDVVLGITHGALLLAALPLVVAGAPSDIAVHGVIAPATPVELEHGLGGWRYARVDVAAPSR